VVVLTVMFKSSQLLLLLLLLLVGNIATVALVWPGLWLTASAHLMPSACGG
jgi:hypothetical protein